MKKQLLFIALLASAFLGINSYAQWSTIATDVSGDGSDSALLDGTELEFMHNDADDVLTFRISTADITTSQSMALGVNIMVNYPGGGSTFNFWGNNNSAAYHRLLTAWVTGSPTTGYSGTIGISDAAGVSGGNYTSLSSNNLDITVNTAANEILIELDRADLIPNLALGEDVVVAAAVGSNMFWNDDIYSPTGTINIAGSGGSDVLVESITIDAAGGVTTITSGDGTLQMSAMIFPANASSDAINWSVVNGTGEATISASGLLTATLNGDVEVTATAADASGVSSSTTITIAIPGLGYDELDLTAISFYPNPASNYLVIENDAQGAALIYAQDGQLVLSKENIVSGQKIDISSLATGVYYLLISADNEPVKGAKFIKK